MDAKIDRMSALLNRLRKLVQLDLQRAGQDNLQVADVIGRMLLLSTQRDIRVETLIELLGASGAVNKDKFAQTFCEKLSLYVEAAQAELNVTVDDHGKVVMTRIH